MATKYLRSGPYEDTPIDEVPDSYLEGCLKAIGGASHPFNKAEEKMIREESEKRRLKRESEAEAAVLGASAAAPSGGIVVGAAVNESHTDNGLEAEPAIVVSEPAVAVAPTPAPAPAPAPAPSDHAATASAAASAAAAKTVKRTK